MHLSLSVSRELWGRHGIESDSTPGDMDGGRETEEEEEEEEKLLVLR